MLKQFSRLEKTRNFIIIAFAFLIGGGLIVFYVPRGQSTAAPISNTEVLAKVGSDEITVGELETLKQQYAQMFGGQINMAALGGDRRFLDGLIRDRIIAQEAKRLGLAASDAEVAEAIRKRFSDASGKFIGLDKYKEAVMARYGSIERFEQQVRDQVAAQKLQAFVTAGVTVSEAEVQEQFRRKNSFFNVTYVPVTVAKLSEKIQPSDEDLRGYYEQHKTDYRYLEPQKKVRYLYIDQAKVGEKIQVSDEDLKKEFDQLKPENRVAGVKIQQIVFKVVRPDLDAVVKEKAENLLKKIQSEGKNLTEEKFAEYARGNSEDAATAKSGGFLAKPYKRDPNKPNALYDRMVDLPVGGVTDVIVKYAGNYYIMRRGEEMQKTFEDAKNELRVSLQNRRSYAVAAALAQRAAEKLKQSKDYGAVARELAAEANMKPEDMVKETPFIKPGDDVPNIGSSQQFEQGIAPLQNPNDVGERTPVKGGFAIPMLLEKRDPRIPEFDEVKDRVATAYKQEQARNRLEQTARDLANNTNAAADLKAAATSAGLEAKEQEDYKLGDPLGEAGTSPAIDDALFSLQAGQVNKAAVKSGEGWVVVGITKRTDPDSAKYATERDKLMQQALTERRNQVFDDYVNAIQARMQREGQIKIYEDVLARIADSDPAAGGQPRIPIPGQ
ncbi:MAG TPA: SurA N-terminal domain-containing protein [Pyrinomonadaceae bacterium]|nr:SurA N-terminal domain-containing protein [Pyrinomonadaceae bacterium]